MIGFSLKYDGKKYTDKTLLKVSEKMDKLNGTIITEQKFDLDGVKIIRIHKRFEKGLEYSLLWFENTSNQNSKQISEVWDLDDIFDDGALKQPTGWWGGDDITQIHLVTGCNNRFNEFRAYKEPIGAFGNYYQTEGGRSSKGFLPFFELRNEQKKIATMLAVGWSSQWVVFFDKTKDGKNVMKAGVENLDFYLLPGEKIRTASVLVYHYTGDYARAHNEWRNTIKNEFSIENKGRGALTVFGTWGGNTEEYQIGKVEQFKRAGFAYDMVHVDAGWFGTFPHPTEYVWTDGVEASGKWYERVGDWQINPILHPTGCVEMVESMRSLAKNVAFWAEFERAHKKTGIPQKHPEWFYKTELGESYLVKLGEKEGYEHAWDVITQMIEKGLSNVVGVDYNIDPLEIFDAEDKPNRRGITQIKYVMGLYRLYDEFNAKYPDCFITNCASGGRRIDIEMITRTYEYHRSDTHCMYDYKCEETQAHNAVLSTWLPYTTPSLLTMGWDKYRFRSTFASGLIMTDLCDFYNDENIEKTKENYDEYLSVREFADKDFYALFGYSRDRGAWGGWQYHDNDKNQGIVMAFRREESNSKTATVCLGGLNERDEYEFVDVDTGEKVVISGKDAKEFDITILNRRESKLIKYKRI